MAEKWLMEEFDLKGKDKFGRTVEDELRDIRNFRARWFEPARKFVEMKLGKKVEFATANY